MQIPYWDRFHRIASNIVVPTYQILDRPQKYLRLEGSQTTTLTSNIYEHYP